MLRAAVVGVGSMGNHHARVYRELNGVELVGVVDSNPDTAQRVGLRHNVHYFSNMETMLDSCNPDVVSLAAPTSLHYELGTKIIERGIHLLVEKPIAASVEEGEKLVQLAEAHGVVLAVGHIERFNPAVMTLARKLEEGMAGPIYKIHTQRLSPYPTRIKDAGVVIDLASHDIDLIRFLMHDEIIRLYGETLQSINSSREDMFNGLMRFRSGAVGVLDVNWITPIKVRNLSITAARGLFVCNLMSQELFFYENGDGKGDWDSLNILRGVSEGNVMGFQIRRHEPLEAELTDFVTAVRERRCPTVTGQDGLETLRLANQFVQSGASVQVIQKQAVLS
jgi:UDP-N-acetylglucosamine 3-dehydrogenase